jgi:AcrR family transcriptional regulator
MDNGRDSQDEHVQRRRGQIITAARKVFAHKGYRCTKTEDIADELGVGKGTLYRYFKDKRDLFLAVDQEGFGRLEELAEPVYHLSDPRERLKALVKLFYEFFDKERDLIEIMMQMRSEFKDEYQLSFSQDHSKHVGRLADTLREGVAKGYFRQMDVVMAAKAIGAMLHGTLHDFYYKRSDEHLADYAQPMTDFIMHGILTTERIQGNKQ